MSPLCAQSCGLVKTSLSSCTGPGSRQHQPDLTVLQWSTAYASPAGLSAAPRNRTIQASPPSPGPDRRAGRGPPTPGRGGLDCTVRTAAADGAPGRFTPQATMRRWARLNLACPPEGPSLLILPPPAKSGVHIADCRLLGAGRRAQGDTIRVSTARQQGLALGTLGPRRHRWVEVTVRERLRGKPA